MFNINKKSVCFDYKYSREELNRRLKELTEVLHKIEEWIFNIHKTTINFTLIGE